MYKAVCSVLILLASLFSAYGIAENYKKQNAVTGELIELFEYIKNQITFFNSPVEIILKNCSVKIVKSLDFSADNFGISKCKDIDFLPQSERKTVNDFFSLFGKTSREEQIKICDYSIGVLKDFAKRRADTDGKKIKSYSCLCMIFGMLFVILII